MAANVGMKQPKWLHVDGGVHKLELSFPGVLMKIDCNLQKLEVQPVAARLAGRSVAHRGH